MLGIARTPVFTRTKWLCDGCGLRSFALKGVLHGKVELKSDRIVMAVYFTRSTDNGEIQQQIRLALSSFEPTLQSSTMICTIHGFTAGVFTGCIHVVDCRGGRRSASVICKAVIADRSGTAVLT